MASLIAHSVAYKIYFCIKQQKDMNFVPASESDSMDKPVSTDAKG